MAGNQSASVLERTVLKSGQLFLVADRGGDIKALNREGHGLYYRDMRHLSLLEMDVSGTRLTLLSAHQELNSMSEQQLTNDALLDDDGRVIAEPRTISVRRSLFLHGSLHERLELFNYNPHAVRLTVRFTCGSDFRNMFDVRGFDVQDGLGKGTVEPIVVQHDGIVLGYSSRTGMQRRTALTFDPPPEHVEIVNPTLRHVVRKEGEPVDQRDEGLVVPPIAAAVFRIELPPMEGHSLTIDATPVADYPRSGRSPSIDGVAPARAVSGVSLDAVVKDLQRSYGDWCAAATSIETSHDGFDAFLSRALLDLHLLVETYDGDLVPTAGIPWFAVPFGRDSLITSMQTLSVRPELARGTLRYLARTQGRAVDPTRGEEPGKILHEVRPGELGDSGQSIYYGSADSTPLFLVALGEYVSWTGDFDLARELLPNAEAALAWMDDYGDLDGDGFVEANRHLPDGSLGSQGWKDSPDSITHRSGERAQAPIALAEIQAYRFAAHTRMAQVYGALGQTSRQQRQAAQAAQVRQLFVERLAMATVDGPYWAMGLDAAKHRIDSVTTNPAHALWAGLLDEGLAHLTVERLLKDDMLSGWGLRTLSRQAVNYNPMSYHNGAVWPHDTAIVALGMKRSGEDAAACRVASEVLEAALQFPGARLPELWCGFARDRGHASTPAQYPVGCSPQAWAAGSAFMLLQALLGLECDAVSGVVHLRPMLPRWLDTIRYRNLRVGAASLDFEVVRTGADGHVAVNVTNPGGLRVETSLPARS